MENKKQKKKLKFSYILNIFLIILVLGISYAWLKTSVTGRKKVSLLGGDLELILDDSMTDGIEINPALPITDEEGKEGQVYIFSLENKSNVELDYELYLVDDEEKKAECSSCEYLEEKDIRYQLLIDGLEVVDTLQGSRLIDVGRIKKGTENKINYELRVWINYEADDKAQGKVFYGKLKVEANQNPDGYESGAPNAPVLSDNMIPVVYNGYSWVKADINNQWYSYERQIWANAVTVTNETRSTYQSAEAGTKVNMNDILMMYVWIPRYSYTIKGQYGKGGQSTTLPGAIDIKFVDTLTQDKGTASYDPNERPKEWYTPPGFTFGNKELSGVWVGKFETGNVNGTNPGDVDPATSKNLVVIKPNITSWRSIRVSTLEEISMGITETGNIYGFDQTTYDAHAAKNTEWALISYLTQSKYGKYVNSLYTGENKQVYMNNYNGYLTGCSSGLPSAESSGTCAYRYDDLTSQGEGTGYAGAGASTTGNIYGIYDMNGGAWEYVMGILADPDRRSGNTEEANSGYTGKLFDGTTFTGREWKDDKYYDFYSSTSTLIACTIDGNKNNPCKGHALNETAGWYGDADYMVSQVYPWMGRGGGHNRSTGAGVFAFNNDYGYAYGSHSFRLVLTPNNN